MQYTYLGEKKEMRDSKIVESWMTKSHNGSLPNYKRQMELFGLTSESCNGEKLLEVGCGPKGGILSQIGSTKKKIGIDVLADRYQEAGLLDFPDDMEIVQMDVLELRKIFKPNSFDRIFCINMLDHGETTDTPEKGFANMQYVLKPTGSLYFHVHCRSQEQINLQHLYALTEQEWLDLAQKSGLRQKKITLAGHDPLHVELSAPRKTYKTLYGIFEKNADIQD